MIWCDLSVVHVRVIRSRLDPAVGGAQFGIDLNEGLALCTLSANARRRLAMNEYLLVASRAHGAWIIANDVFSHSGAGGNGNDLDYDADGVGGAAQTLFVTFTNKRTDVETTRIFTSCGDDGV